MIMLTLGTGVGGGIIIGDLSVDGEHSHGSELGHVILDYHEDARVCPCGHTGHLEAYASATSLVKRTYEMLSDGVASSLSDRIAKGETLSALLIDEEAEKGDALAWEVILETAMYLGVGIVTLMNTIDPAAIVLGGAMTFGGHGSDVGRKFIARVREEVAKRAFPVPRERTVIDFASLGGDAGYIGAAGIGRIAFSKK
jgi:glucokinase